MAAKITFSGQTSALVLIHLIILLSWGEHGVHQFAILFPRAIYSEQLALMCAHKYTQTINKY